MCCFHCLSGAYFVTIIGTSQESIKESLRSSWAPCNLRLGAAVCQIVCSQEIRANHPLKHLWSNLSGCKCLPRKETVTRLIGNGIIILSHTSAFPNISECLKFGTTPQISCNHNRVECHFPQKLKTHEELRKGKQQRTICESFRIWKKNTKVRWPPSCFLEAKPPKPHQITEHGLFVFLVRVGFVDFAKVWWWCLNCLLRVFLSHCVNVSTISIDKRSWILHLIHNFPWSPLLRLLLCRVRTAWLGSL